MALDESHFSDDTTESLNNVDIHDHCRLRCLGDFDIRIDALGLLDRQKAGQAGSMASPRAVSPRTRVFRRLAGRHVRTIDFAAQIARNSISGVCLACVSPSCGHTFGDHKNDLARGSIYTFLQVQLKKVINQGPFANPSGWRLGITLAGS